MDSGTPFLNHHLEPTNSAKTGIHSTQGRFVRGLLAISALTASLWATEGTAQAENLIKRPGAHNRYKFEVEPHLVGYVANWRGSGSHAGPGVRFSIPFMHNGPIDTINNNIGISFGVDTFFPGGDVLFSSPVAFQWNFYFTDIISVIGEAGLVTNIWTGPGDTFDFDPLFQGGGRFQFGKVGVVVRVGYPTISVGANFQF